MDFSTDVLRYDEKVIFNLRALYSKHGYADFKMSHFEEYELYASNRAFLPSGEIIAFTDAGGKLMALRPDVTLSIIKSINDTSGLKKLYYNENVYRTVEGELKEQMQVGLECIGEIDTQQVAQVLWLAKQSLDMLGGGAATRLVVSHMGFLSALLSSDTNALAARASIMRCLSEKNIPGLRRVCEVNRISGDLCEKLTSLASLYGAYPEVIGKLRSISMSEETNAALDQLEEIDRILKGLDIGDGIRIDFSVAGDITYYNDIVFQGFIDGLPSMVLSGGRYDKLLRSFGKSGGAIGFAVYLDLLTAQSQSCACEEKVLSIALPKGRLGEEAYRLFAEAGYECPDILETSRKLVLENPEKQVRYFWVKPSDVAIYVERGAADLGVVGKDTLLEQGRDVFELLDLGLGECRMCVAAKKGTNSDGHDKTLRVATKFPNIARRHFAARACNIDIIKLHGSIELAPLIGLSDVIVDLVQTGATLKENDMEPVETIEHISARLIANKAGYKFNSTIISRLCEKIMERVTKDNDKNC